MSSARTAATVSGERALNEAWCSIRLPPATRPPPFLGTLRVRDQRAHGPLGRVRGLGGRQAPVILHRLPAGGGDQNLNARAQSSSLDRRKGREHVVESAAQPRAPL